LEILFPDDQSRQLYEKKAQLNATFGNELGNLICRRLSMFKATATLALVPACWPVNLVSNGDGSYSVALGPSHRLAFRAVSGGSGQISYEHITQVQIIGIIDA
jgi:hypothetical protein